MEFNQISIKINHSIKYLLLKFNFFTSLKLARTKTIYKRKLK